MRRSVPLQLAGWSVVAAIDFALNPRAYATHPWLWAGYAALSLAAFGLLVSWALAWFHRRRPTLTLGQLLGSTLVGSALWYTLGFAMDWLVDFPDAAPFVNGLFGKGMLLLFIMGTWHGGLAAWSASQREEEARRLAQQSKLEALRYQLNPHFLFNLLNSAIALIDERPERAQRMLTLLAQLLRETLYSEQQVVALATEVELVRRYLEIESIRFEDRLTVTWNVPDGARVLRVPSLALHALVENAIKHGMKSAKHLQLNISAQTTNRMLQLAVRNTGEFRPTHPGVGVKNIRQRLDALLPGQTQVRN